jgi:hypothetical protein
MTRRARPQKRSRDDVREQVREMGPMRDRAPPGAMSAILERTSRWFVTALACCFGAACP